MNFRKITLAYYATRLGIDPVDFGCPGVRLVRSAERDKAQPGYGRPFDLYIWVAGETLIVSCGDKAAAKLPAFAEGLRGGMSAHAVAALAGRVWGVAPRHNLKFVLDTLPPLAQPALLLQGDEYENYLAFFLACHPGCRETDWLREYYDEMVARGLCFGEMAEGKLVCANDLPTMPYMADQVQEIGINTHPNYRHQGHAKRVCLTAAHALVARGLCPQWGTDANNAASEHLAYALGFENLAEVVTLTL